MLCVSLSSYLGKKDWRLLVDTRQAKRKSGQPTEPLQPCDSTEANPLKPPPFAREPMESLSTCQPLFEVMFLGLPLRAWIYLLDDSNMSGTIRHSDQLDSVF